ncbi:MAG: AAA family ATPase, partial [Gemmataceae bacterium]
MFQWLQSKQKQNTLKNTLKQYLVRHMGGPCEKAQIISHTIKPIERVNLHLALEEWFRHNQGSAEVLGYASFLNLDDRGVAHLLRDDAQISLAPIEREQFLQAPGHEVDCVTRGIFLLRFENHPVIVLLRHPDRRWEEPRLELMAHERQLAQSALKHLLDEVNRHIVYKGKAIYLERISQFSQEVSIRFHGLPSIARENIVLPEAVMEVVERNVLGLLKHGELLRRSGRATRHGLLLHGPPGTGKTLMLRYLARACPEHTIVLLSGRQMGLIRESCEVARLLAPSLIVLE